MRSLIPLSFLALVACGETEVADAPSVSPDHHAGQKADGHDHHAARKAEAHGDGHEHGEAASAGAATTDADGWQVYGAVKEGEQTLVKAADLLADPSRFVDQPLRIEGRVADVCQKKGCWMVIAEGDKSMRVLMKDHAFSVDMQGAGSDCQIDGVVVAEKKDPETVAHFEGEAAEGAIIPEKSVEGDTVYQLVAEGVRMKKPQG
jgi:hypothetical protein